MQRTKIKLWLEKESVEYRLFAIFDATNRATETAMAWLFTLISMSEYKHCDREQFLMR